MNLIEDLPTEFDYYSVLNVPRDATPEQITLSYRKLALQYHPHKDENMKPLFNPPEGFNEESHLPSLSKCAIWLYINKAYDILSCSIRREVYDRYGEHGLTHGVPLPCGYFQPYCYHNDCFKTFKDVFATYSPYANLIDAITYPPPLYSTELGDIGVKVKDKPIEKIIYLDLREIYFGTVKRMKILRNEFANCDETVTELREKILMVPIAPGLATGTTITFKGEGDRFPTKIPADIIFITADKPHEVFERDGSNLHMHQAINLKEALCGFKLTIKTVDNRKLKILISDIVQPNYVKVIKSEGLPIPGDNKCLKGDLFLHFCVKFPMAISKPLKAQFISFFKELEEYNLQEEKNIKCII